MAIARIKVETTNEILFINRPLPPENIDLFLYVEDQITELLLADETLSDTVYRFSENSDEIVIAVARKKILVQKPLPARGGNACYRIPSAIDLWIKAKKSLQQSKAGSLLFGIYGDHVFLVYANATQVQRVFQFNADENLDRDLLLAVEKLQKLYPKHDVPLKMICRDKLSDHIVPELRLRSIECTGLIDSGVGQTPGESETLEQWDFRLDNEINDQILGREKQRALFAGLISITGALVVWLLLMGTNTVLERSEERSLVKWQNLRASLKEITYLQKQIRQSIGEIMLCKTLSEKRTRRAVVLEKIASTRPVELKLEQIRIGERRKRMEKEGTSPVSEDAVFLKGYSNDGNLITEWMDLLVKSKAFTSVTMVSMEKKVNTFHFQIECTIGL